MKAIYLIVLGSLVWGASVVAATASTVEDAGVAAVPAKKKVILEGDSKTSHSFEDLLVQGQYHFSDESVTTVEEDKVLDALIGVRTDFKDRLKKSSANR